MKIRYTVFYINCSTNESIEVLQVECVHVIWLYAIINGAIQTAKKYPTHCVSIGLVILNGETHFALVLVFIQCKV